MGVGYGGEYLTWNGSQWSAPVTVTGAGELLALSCVSASFCVAGDVDGDVFEWNGTSWSEPDNISFSEIFSISCPSATFCIASNSNGDIYASSSVPTASVSVADNAASLVPGESLVFTAKVTGSGSTPTGSVSWTISGPGSPSCGNSTLNLSGQATCTISGAQAGVYAVTANYLGDSTYPAASGSDTRAVVLSAGTRATIGAGSPDVLPATCSCGAPVNTDTGEFWHAFGDLAVPGRGVALNLTRTYSSLRASVLGRFGFGWSDPYDKALSFDASGNVTLREGNGSSVRAVVSGSTYTFPSYVLATLVKNTDGTYTFTRKNKSRYVFSSTGQLVAEVDRNGYKTTLTHNGAELTKVTDPAGRSLTFSYGGNGLVSKVTDPAGRSVSFAYDGAKELITVTDVGGGSWSFTYGTQLLLTMVDPRGGATTNTYDASGRITSQSDPGGHTTTYAYSGAPDTGTGTTTVTDPRGYASTYTYSNDELVSTTQGAGTASAATWNYVYAATTHGQISVTDPDGHTTTSTYDSRGNLLSQIDPLSRKATYTYNAFNEPLTVTDPRGVTTSDTYDAYGNLLTQTVGSRITTYKYADSTHRGDVTAVLDAAGHTTHFAYDAHGDQTSITNPDGRTTTATYNTIGEKLSSTTPRGKTTIYTYDAFGHVLTTTDPMGHVSSEVYDGDQNRVSATDPSGNTTSYAYDADNELTTTTEPGGATRSSTYNPDGLAVSTTDANGHTTTYAYDPLDRLISSTDPLGHTTHYTYDAAGNQLTATDASGRVTTHTYDADNEPKTVSYSDGTTHGLSYAYDADGRRTHMTDATGATTYAYNLYGDLVSSTNGAGAKVALAYNSDGWVTSLAYPNGMTVRRGYDAAGNLTSLTDWLGHTSTFAYDADGNLTSQVDGSTTQVTDRATYNADDALTSMTATVGTKTLQGFTYARNANSLVSTATPTGQSAQTYSYDVRNKLSTDADGSYAYDPSGNPTRLLATYPLAYNAADELTTSVVSSTTTTYTYNALGERTGSTPSGGTASTYGYDQGGNLTSFARGTTSATYVFNGDGLRVAKTVGSATTAFTWETATGMPLLLAAGATSYLYGPAGLPLEQITGSSERFFHHDHLGSTTMLTGDAGTKVATYTYSSFGKTLSHTGTATTSLLYASQYRDAESGLYYLRARLYDPSTAQFLSVDPALSVTGEPYNYVSDDPVNATDPTGACGIPDYSSMVSEAPDAVWDPVHGWQIPYTPPPAPTTLSGKAFASLQALFVYTAGFMEAHRAVNESETYGTPAWLQRTFDAIDVATGNPQHARASIGPWQPTSFAGKKFLELSIWTSQFMPTTPAPPDGVAGGGIRG